MIFDRYRFNGQLAMDLGEKILLAVVALVVEPTSGTTPPVLVSLRPNPYRRERVWPASIVFGVCLSPPRGAVLVDPYA